MDGAVCSCARLKQKLGLEISLNVTSRWDVGIIGGPTVTPEDAMKMMTWSRIDRRWRRQRRRYSCRRRRRRNGFYRPIAVLAYPLHHGAPLPGSRRKRPRTRFVNLEFKTASRETGFSMPQSDRDTAQWACGRRRRGCRGRRGRRSELAHGRRRQRLEWNFRPGRGRFCASATPTRQRRRHLTDAAGNATRTAARRVEPDCIRPLLARCRDAAAGCRETLHRHKSALSGHR